MHTSTHLGTAIALALGAGAAAQTVTFEMIPDPYSANDAFSANDLSPDGRFVVGEAFNAPYRWDRQTDTFTQLPGAVQAVAVSDDGTVVLGTMIDGGTGAEVAARWTAATGWQSLGWLPDANQCPSLSNGYELSADGNTAVGLSWDGCSGRGFVWTAATGIQELQPLANGGNRASVVSADGAVIAGFAQGSFDRTPATWDDEGTGTLLDPPNGDATGEVQGISDDGTTILGEWNGSAFRKDGNGPIEIIGAGSLIPIWDGIATDVADDEGTVVGFDIFVGSRRAWYQPGGAGPLRHLKTFLEANGNTVPFETEVLQAISRDGTVMIGHTAFQGAWIVTITPPCDADVNDDGVVDVTDLVAVILAWGTNDAAADIDGSGLVDVSDLVEVVLAWGACPGA